MNLLLFCLFQKKLVCCYLANVKQNYKYIIRATFSYELDAAALAELLDAAKLTESKKKISIVETGTLTVKQFFYANFRRGQIGLLLKKPSSRRRVEYFVLQKLKI